MTTTNHSTLNKKSFFSQAMPQKSDQQAEKNISANEISPPEKKFAAKNEIPSDPALVVPSAEEISFAEKIPCRKCGVKLFWESIYLDGELRCCRCEPIPSDEFVGRLVCLHDDGTWQVKNPRESRRAGEGRHDDQRQGPAAANCTTLADGVGDWGEGRRGESYVDAADLSGDDVVRIELPADYRGPADLDDDPTSVFVRYVTADGRGGWARRGWNNPRSPEFNPRLCLVASVGEERAEREFDAMDREIRREWGWDERPGKEAAPLTPAAIGGGE